MLKKPRSPVSRIQPDRLRPTPWLSCYFLYTITAPVARPNDLALSPIKIQSVNLAGSCGSAPFLAGHGFCRRQDCLDSVDSVRSSMFLVPIEDIEVTHCLAGLCESARDSLGLARPFPSVHANPLLYCLRGRVPSASTFCQSGTTCALRGTRA